MAQRAETGVSVRPQIPEVPQTLRERFPSPYGKIVSEEVAIQMVREWKGSGLTVVMADAVLDIPHYRHANFFRACANMGDKLLVRIGSDKLVTQRKDPKGPVVGWEERAMHAANYPYIDLITIKDDGGWQFIQDYQPDVIVKSVTSGMAVLNEIDEILPVLDSLSLSFVVLDQFAQPVSIENIMPEGLAYEQDKLGSDKFSGTIIKDRIAKRTIDDFHVTT